MGLGASQYTTLPVINRLGGFCIAQDAKVADHIWTSPQLSVKSAILNSIDVILLSLLFGLLLGLIYLGLVVCLPKLMIRLAFIGAFVVLLFAGIFILAKPVQLFSNNLWNILLAVLLIIMAITFLIYMLCYNR